MLSPAMVQMEEPDDACFHQDWCKMGGTICRVRAAQLAIHSPTGTVKMQHPGWETLTRIGDGDVRAECDHGCAAGLPLSDLRRPGTSE